MNIVLADDTQQPASSIASYCPLLNSEFAGQLRRIWSLHAADRMQVVSELPPPLQLRAANSNYQIFMTALSDPAWAVRDLAAEKILAAIRIHAQTQTDPKAGFAFVREVFSHLLAPALIAPGRDDSRMPQGQMYRYGRTLEHTRLMGLRIVQRAAIFQSEATGLLQAYFNMLGSDSGFFKTNTAHEISNRLPRHALALSTTELAQVAGPTKGDVAFWRALQLTRHQLSNEPSLDRTQWWAPSFRRAWVDCTPHFTLTGV